VVEVGVDIPNATVMMIEGANRFGLAQLHQFRGRVGRSEYASYCLLLPDTEDEASSERLKAMEATNDGFRLAELDLEQRGPGDFLGSRQSGFAELRLARLTDIHLIEKARREAQRLFESDPGLSAPEHQDLGAAVARFWSGGRENQLMVRAVFRERFDPIHNGHIDIAMRARSLFDELIVAVYDKPLKTLVFSPEERLEMVHVAFDSQAGVKVVGYSGLTVEFCRQVKAKVIVRGLRVFSDFEHEFRMALSTTARAGHRGYGIDHQRGAQLPPATVREIASLGGRQQPGPLHVAAACAGIWGARERLRAVPLTDARLGRIDPERRSV
jgi:pantetheine-phosphate adenylyltransferase